MKPAPFEYHAPATLPEALGLLAEFGAEATPLAGGQSLTPLMNLRLARPVNLVDLNRIESMRALHVGDGAVKVDALVRHATLERSEEVNAVFPVARAVAPFIGYPAIRHRGTVVGSIAHADPAAEWPCVALAFDAEITLAKSGSSRTVPASSFFKTMLTTVREPDELVTQVAFDTGFDTWGFYEFARRYGDFAVIAVVVAARTENGIVTDARISLAGAGDRPLRVPEAETLLEGQPVGAESARAVAGVAAEAVDPLGDIHGSAEYRRELVRVGVERALLDAGGRMEGGIA
jgi:carbon-monoxide dehydrogenase medium subunit